MAVTVQIYQLIFNCTLTQYNTLIGTTLPGLGGTVVQGPNKFEGILKATSGTLAGKGNCDIAYDGKYFVRFFGSNLTLAMVNQLTTSLNGTLGAPVPPDQAVPPTFVP